MYIFSLILTLMVFIPAAVYAQDSTHVIIVKDITPKESFLKKLDGTFNAAPHYSSEMGFGVAMQYMFSTPFTVIGNITTEGYILAGFTGTSTSRNKKWKFNYKGYFNYAPTYFWGFGYESAENKENRSRYDSQKLHLQFDAAYYATPHFSFGPSAGYEWIAWKNFNDSNPSSQTLNYGIFATLDTRDVATRATEGIYAHFRQKNYTNLSGSTSLQFDWYTKVWEGGIIASDIYSIFTYGNFSEQMLPTIGGTERMRGYYYGRYRNNNIISAQIELRQTIWQMIGGAVWVGGANLWGKYNKFQLSNTLPNYGLGARITITDNLRLRVDYGFGKDGQNCFILSINEAF